MWGREHWDGGKCGWDFGDCCFIFGLFWSHSLRECVVSDAMGMARGAPSWAAEGLSGIISLHKTS